MFQYDVLTSRRGQFRGATAATAATVSALSTSSGLGPTAHVPNILGAEVETAECSTPSILGAGGNEGTREGVDASSGGDGEGDKRAAVVATPVAATGVCVVFMVSHFCLFCGGIWVL